MNEAIAKFDVSDRVAFVTGASSGLGRQAAMTLAAAGANVVCVARPADAKARWADADRASTAFVIGQVVMADSGRSAT